MNKTLTLPPKTLELVNEYKSLPQIGLHTPYYINRSKQHFSPPVLVGKGNPKEISEEILKYISKDKLNNEALLKVCKEHRIGVDCSGLVSIVLDKYLKEVKGSEYNLKDYIKIKGGILQKTAFRIRPLPNMNSNSITDIKNCIEVKKAKDIRIADLIRFSGGSHVGLVSNLVYNNSILKEISYLHSTEGSGVSEDRIIINNEDKGLEVQEWIPNPNAKRQPEYLFRRRINNNGIRRLNILK